jgi:hypothetical protein
LITGLFKFSVLLKSSVGWSELAAVKSELELVERFRFLNRASIEFGLELEDLWSVDEI